MPRGAVGGRVSAMLSLLPMSLQFIKAASLSDLATTAGYGLVVRSNDLVFLSGMTARDAAGTMVGIGDFEAQCVQVYENMRACLAAAGGTLADVISLRTYLTDRAHRQLHATVCRRYFPGPDFPCSTLLVVALGSPELLLEVEAIAHVEAHQRARRASQVNVTVP
jgi:2-iminobutanoate/2-iminopropanoate deaminase